MGLHVTPAQRAYQQDGALDKLSLSWGRQRGRLTRVKLPVQAGMSFPEGILLPLNTPLLYPAAVYMTCIHWTHASCWRASFFGSTRLFVHLLKLYRLRDCLSLAKLCLRNDIQYEQRDEQDAQTTHEQPGRRRSLIKIAPR